MNTTPRNLPRFLPTLTEVVHQPGLDRMPSPATPQCEEIVQTVMRRVEKAMEKRMGEKTDALVRAMMGVQLQTMQGALREEMESIVREAVSEAMASSKGQTACK